MTALDTYGRKFLRITLEIDKHIAGYIDGYYGPASLKAAVADASLLEPKALLDDIAALHEQIPTADPARQATAVATLRALDCSLRLLNGDSISYLEEVNRLYDISPSLVDESQFAEAHHTLDSLLPGSGNIAERLRRHRKHYDLQADRILPVLKLAHTETRRRTAQFIALPDDASIEIKLTKGQPWSAYNWYLGNGRSLVEFNTDIPLNALGIVNTMAHEGYPGHHTEALLKEQKIYREKGYGEQAAMLLHSPAAVIAEGIATTAVEIIFPNRGEYEWIIDVLLPEAGLAVIETADQIKQIIKATSKLRYTTGNAAILYHSGKLNEEQTIDYIQTYALSTPDRAARSFGFLSHPLYRSYLFTYTQGYDLIADAAANGDKREIFDRCLTEQILPSHLAIKN